MLKISKSGKNSDSPTVTYILKERKDIIRCPKDSIGEKQEIGRVLKKQTDCIIIVIIHDIDMQKEQCFARDLYSLSNCFI